MKIVIAGASGFLGKALISSLPDCEVIALNRSYNPQPGARVVAWDGRTVGDWEQELNGADAIVNLAGSPAAVKWTQFNRERIVESRVEPTQAIARALQEIPKPPRVWMNASAVGYYGNAGEQTLTEQSPRGTGFLADVCEQWEDAAMRSSLPSVRRILLRIGLPLGRGGGALEPLQKLARYGLGGSLGDGSQWWPWIHIDDLTAMIRWCIENEIVSGPVNACSPEPERNCDLMKSVRHALHRPWAPPAPKLALALVGKLFGPDPEALLASQRAVSRVAMDSGFQWRFPSLEAALNGLLG